MRPESATTSVLEVNFGDGKSASYSVPTDLAAAVVAEPRLYNSEIRGKFPAPSGLGLLDIALDILTEL
jgi:hypothetical protein